MRTVSKCWICVLNRFQIEVKKEGFYNDFDIWANASSRQTMQSDHNKVTKLPCHMLQYVTVILLICLAKWALGIIHKDSPYLGQFFELLGT